MKGLVNMMVCPNCGSNMSDKKKRCERCGEDLTVYKKINRASNLYYNKGLEKARVRDLTGATIALRNSLDLNKWNTDARNLLGLVYYEMGETVAALSEWVISKHFQATNNDADVYINKVQSNPTKLDSLNQAIKRYNTALNYAKQKSDDLAIIQLKKVVTLNPHFIRAYQLLALLQMKTGETDRARRNLIRASRIDVSNTTTLKYLRELEAPAASKDPDSNPEAEQGVPNAIMPISSYREDKPNIMAFINLVIGVVIGLAVMAILVIPTLKKNEPTQKGTDYDDISLVQMQEKDNTINELESDKETLQQQIEQLQTQIENIVIPEDKSVVYSPLINAMDLYMAELEKPSGDRDYTMIADQLAAMDAGKFEFEAATSLYSRLKSLIYPGVAKLYYNLGRDFYSAKDYEKALVEFRKAMTFDPTDEDAIYFAARSCHRLGDTENAILYYSVVVTDFPNSNRTKDAKNYLNQLQN